MNEEPVKRDDAHRDATQFSAGNIEEICQMAAIAWWPVRTKGESAKKKRPGSDEVSLMETAHVLGARARANDPDALLRLFIMMAAAQLESWQLSKDSKVLQRAAEHSPM